jgi:hypothetical protein
LTGWVEGYVATSPDALTLIQRSRPGVCDTLGLGFRIAGADSPVTLHGLTATSKIRRFEDPKKNRRQ